MKEEWRPISGYEGLYDVSNYGGVRSYYNSHRKSRVAPKRLRLNLSDPRGCAKIALWNDSGIRWFFVHRLVLAAFVGPCLKGMQCCHNDGDASNNRVGNLRWDTPSSNQRDRFRHDTHGLGERNGRCKLNELQVRIIKRLGGRIPQRAIGGIFGVSQTTIRYILQGRNWTHL